jgi:hypothetical protein
VIATEIGPLGRMLVLRGFDDTSALVRERHRALMSKERWHVGQVRVVPIISRAQASGRTPELSLRAVCCR